MSEPQSKNLLLAAIAPDEFERLRPFLEAYPLRTRETLQEAGETPEFVFFPTSGIISDLTVLENGMMIEFATIGREGTTGATKVMYGASPFSSKYSAARSLSTLGAKGRNPSRNLIF